MAKTQNSAVHRDPAAITKPIPLLAFVGTLVEAIIGIIAGVAKDTEAFPLLAAGLLALPLVLIFAIHNLITKHHGNLYAPSDFANPDHFLDLVRSSSGRIMELASTERSNIFLPFRYSAPLPEGEQADIRQHVARIEPILESLNPKDFSALHSWYNTIERHEFAILCIDIAVARGEATSRNFAFRSASLRKLGRLVEAKYSALLSVELDAENADGHYNVAKAYSIMGDRVKAHEAADRVYRLGSDKHSQKLQAFFAASENRS